VSLLLEALQNAAKNREAAAPEGGVGPSNAAKESAAELSLEPMPEPAQTQAGARTRAASRNQNQSTPADDGRERAAGAGSQQAQTVLRAGARLARPSIFSWIARRPLVAFSTASGLFAIGYGVYLYLQITNPGIFIAYRTPTPPTPVVPTVPARQPPAALPAPPTIPSMATSTPAPGLPGPTFTPAPRALPPSTSTIGSAPLVAPPSATSPAPARAPAPPAQATPAPTTNAVSPTPTPAVKPARARRAAAARPAAKPVSSEGIAPSATSQVIPVSRTLVSAHQALEKGQLDDAERMYRQSLVSDPRSIDAMLGLATTLTQQNKADAATQSYLRVLEQDPRNAFAQAGLLNITGRIDPAAAEERLKQLIAREPSGFLHFSLGNLYAEQGRWAGAQAAYFQAHNLAPDNPDYAFNLAIGLEHVSQPKIALNYYRRAVSLAQARGHAQFDSGKVQARIRSIETALAETP